MSFRFQFAFTSIFLVTISSFAQNSLSVEKIMRDPKWMGTSPSGISWGDVSNSIYFNWNPDNNPADSLYQYSLDTKKISKVQKEDKISLSLGSGIYNKDFSKKIYSKSGDLYLYDSISGNILRLTETNEIETNPSFSIDGKSVFFQKDNNFYSIKLESGALKQVTDFDKGSKNQEKKKTEEETWLEKDQLALFEVLSERKNKETATKKQENEIKKLKKIYLDSKRLTETEISPNGDFVVFSTMESPKNSKSTIVPNYVNTTGYTEDISARNKVGSPQSILESFLFDFKRDTVLSLKYKNLPGIETLPLFLKEYGFDTLKEYKNRRINFGQFVWSPSGKNLVAVARSVDNKDRWIVKIDIQNGKVESLDHQHDEAWIAGPGIGGAFGGSTLGFIDEDNIYFQSEFTGYSHLYRYTISSKTKTTLTTGNFEVQKVILSRDKKQFYISANKEHPGEQHFYHLSVNGGELQKVTSMKGANEVTISPDEKLLAIRYSYSNKPWELFLQENLPGKNAIQITTSSSKEFNSYPWLDPQLLSFKARDGQEVFGRIYKPKKSNKKAVIFVHGAGYLQNAHSWWSSYFREYMFHNLLVEKGYTVFDIDYRGSAGYGRDVRTGIYRHMGGKDLTDHLDAAEFLAKNHGINPQKIGIYGGSYGGFITLMALFTAPGTFKAGAALRPVTDWAAYNHGYTSNILNTPQSDSLAYKRSSPIYFAKGLTDNLLICHGVVDVNVHYQDVVRLTQRLIELKKDNWEVASYPVEDHGFVEPSSWTDEYKRILKLFEEKLK
ncbi:MAG: S9 family peptidase [Cytophagaceae bacterium]|nr:S9 family peptidase [Cytophagaceae bacterium]